MKTFKRMVERTMTQAEAEELVEAINITLIYLPMSASRADMRCQLVNGGWWTNDIPSQEAVCGYQVELDTTPIYEEVDALTFLGLESVESAEQIKQAFRQLVKKAADGKGNYKGDMDNLVQAKELAMAQWG